MAGVHSSVNSTSAMPTRPTPTIADIQRALRKPLPGLAAQLRMSPPGRPSQAPAEGMPVREAGVLLLLYPKVEQLHFVLTRRAERLGSHKGQISFPGGRREPSDRDFADTALRESFEELGILSETVHILGELTPLYVPPSNFMIHPVVGYTDAPPVFMPNLDEVAEVIEVPLWQMLDPVTKGAEMRVLVSQNGKPVLTPHYRIGTHSVWGATAMVLSEFEALLDAA